MIQLSEYHQKRSTNPIYASRQMVGIIVIWFAISTHPLHAQGNSDPTSTINIKGALGFVLGESKQEAVGKAIAQYKVLTGTDQIRTGDRLTFTGGLYMRWEASMVNLEFKDNKLGWIFIEIRQNSFEEAEQAFIEIKRKLLEKYGSDLFSRTDSRVEDENTVGIPLEEDEVAHIMWEDTGYILSLHLYEGDTEQPYVLVTYQDVMMTNEIEESSDY